MLSTHKQKKKKQREQLVKKQILKRREAIRKKARHEKEIEKTMRASEVKKVPIRNSPPNQQPQMSPEEVKAKIAHNMKILKELEAARQSEVDAREKMNNNPASLDEIKAKIEEETKKQIELAQKA